jgi:hypothetical protein
MREIKIRDLRRKEKFVIDDEYLNGYARLCGWNATLVYMSICRHADKDQYSFPSIRRMAQQHNVSEKSIERGIRALEAWNIVKVIKKERSQSGTWLCNGYYLLDKEEWKKKPTDCESDGRIQQTVSPSPTDSQSVTQQTHSRTKDTHTEGNTYKDTHPPEQSSEGRVVNELIDLFKELNPSYALFFKRPPQRDAAKRLLKLHNLPWWAKFIPAYRGQLETDRYCPRAITPIQLEEKIGSIELYAKSKKAESLKARSNVII